VTTVQPAQWSSHSARHQGYAAGLSECLSIWGKVSST
jgi:hypothetical protein